MAAIGSIRIGYGDTQLFSVLMGLKYVPAEHLSMLASNTELSKYELPSVSAEALVSQNVLVDMNRRREMQIYRTDDNYAQSDQIIFSRQKGSIFTSANTCFSYMLFCRQLNLGSGVHVSTLHSNDPLFHKEMLFYALSNMLKLADGLPLSAYISGGYVFSNEKDSVYMNGQMAPFMQLNNQWTMTVIVPELLGRGITIEAIDIGRDYLHQELRLLDGKYTASTARKKKGEDHGYYRKATDILPLMESKHGIE